MWYNHIKFKNSPFCLKVELSNIFFNRWEIGPIGTKAGKLGFSHFLKSNSKSLICRTNGEKSNGTQSDGTQSDGEKFESSTFKQKPDALISIKIKTPKQQKLFDIFSEIARKKITNLLMQL
jgi:hypothetical protein